MLRTGLVVMLTACGVSPAGMVAQVELGTGMGAFVALPTTGATAELVLGPQGGWHVSVAARMWADSAAALDGALLRYEARAASGVELGHTELELDPARVLREGDHWLRLGDRVVFAITAPAEVVGTSVELAVDIGGATDARQLTIIDAAP